MKNVKTSNPVVLFVDDEKRVLRSLERLMFYEPFSVRTAGSALEALQVLENEHVDAVISDEKMPVKSGSEFLSEVREKYPDVCRIMLTGQAELSSAVRAINEGRIFRFLLKPIKLNELVLAITECLDEKLKFEQEFDLSQQTAGVCSLDMTITVNGETEYKWSANARRMLEVNASDLLDDMSVLYQRIHPDDLEKVTELHRRCSSLLVCPEIEFRINLPKGGQRWISQVTDVFKRSGNKKYRVIVVFKDITLSHKHLDLLHYQAYHDSLTGMGNRALFMQELEKRLKPEGKKKANVEILFMDIDDFKLVNDSMGHVFGDWLLNSFAARIKDAIADGVVVARFGGDEFAMLVSDTDGIDIRKLAEKIVEILKRPFSIEDYKVYVNVSIGITATKNREGLTVHDLLREADTAMYAAKGKSDSPIRVFESSMRDIAADKFKMTTELYQALIRDEFFLEYQPIVALTTCKTVGFEALVRWNHPSRGLVMPDAFIPLAEENGAILELGMRVADLACKQLAAWSCASENSFFMSFNVSVRQFHQIGFVDKLEEIICRTGVSPDRLKVEVTESGLMDDVELSMKIMNKIKELGVHIQIDDFGTGYSSLAYLQRIPAENLKIDKSFVSNVNADQDKFAIVRTIIDLARSVGMKTVAEGVEKVEELSILRQLGCDYVQGYLFDRPLCSKAAGEAMDYSRLSSK